MPGHDSQPRPSSIIIKRASKDDLAAMVDVHIMTNANAYLTSLGSRFLSAMYGCFISDPRAISLVARDSSSGGLAGVAIGCVDVQSFYRKVGLHMAYPYARAFVSAWLQGRSLGVGLSSRYKNQSGILPKGDIAYIAQLNISPDNQGRRIGSRLIDRFFWEVLQKGTKRVYVIANEENVTARKVYEKMGCVLEKSYITPAAVKRCLYTKDLSEDSIRIPA